MRNGAGVADIAGSWLGYLNIGARYAATTLCTLRLFVCVLTMCVCVSVCAYADTGMCVMRR